MKFDELGWFKQTLIAIAILVTAAFAPELMLLVDLGGIDLALGFLLLYYKSLIAWFIHKKQQLIETLQIAKAVVINSALGKPKVFTVNMLCCTAFLLITGSTLLSYGLLAPALFISS